jgi:hypothetical protein
LFADGSLALLEKGIELPSETLAGSHVGRESWLEAMLNNMQKMRFYLKMGALFVKDISNVPSNN